MPSISSTALVLYGQPGAKPPAARPLDPGRTEFEVNFNAQSRRVDDRDDRGFNLRIVDLEARRQRPGRRGAAEETGKAEARGPTPEPAADGRTFRQEPPSDPVTLSIEDRSVGRGTFVAPFLAQLLGQQSAAGSEDRSKRGLASYGNSALRRNEGFVLDSYRRVDITV
jgi:hypothetical protein